MAFRAALATLTLTLLAACGPSIAPPSKPAPSVPDGAPETTVPAVVAEPIFNDDVGENPLKIYMIDVGQGDSLLIETGGGKRVLIDTGPSSARQSLLSWLDAKGVTRIDLLINTHAHADHIANTWKVIETRDIGQVLDSGMAHTARDYEKMLDAVERKGIPFKIARQGRKIDLGDGVTLTVLSPEEPLVSGSRSDINANSVVVRLDLGAFSMLFTGDSEAETEQRMLRLPPESLKATLLKVAHHGSRHATQDAFLKAVGPRVALISAAQKNRYNHPAPETLARLSRAGITTFETRLHGTITVATDGKGLRITTEKVADAALVATVSLQGEEAPEEEALPTAKLNLNTATREALIELPGVGPATADRILAWRTANGPFATVEDLRKVSGIGAKTMDKLRPLVMVPPPGS